MRLRIALRRLILLAIIVASAACPGQTLARLPGSTFRPMLFQGTPGFSTTPPSPIDLGPSAVGITTPHAFPQLLQINNPGTAPLSISSFSFTSFEANFTAESVFLPPITVNPGSTRTPGVLFTPQGPGKRTVQLSIIDNAPGSPHLVEFTGTGVAVAANDIAVILDPAVTTVNVPAGSGTAFPIWLLSGTSQGNTIVNLQCSGGPSGTTCALDNNSTFLTGDSFGPTRDKIMVTISVPAKSVLAFHGNPSSLVDGCVRIRNFIGMEKRQKCPAFRGACSAAHHQRCDDFLRRQQHGNRPTLGNNGYAHARNAA